MHEVEVDIINTQRGQRGVDAVLDTVVPCVVQLGGDPNLFTRDARVFDSVSDFLFVRIRESTEE